MSGALWRGLLLHACAALFAADAPAAPTQDIAADRTRVREAEARRAALLERVGAAVVAIFADARQEGGGSGVIIDPRGYGLTNYHVIAEMLRTRRGVGGLRDGRLYPLRVLGIDPGGDVALFRLEGRDAFEHAPLGDSDDLTVGEWVAALGNPFLLAEDFTPTVTFGVISGLHRYQSGQGNMLEYADCIQVSTSINPGNSGGPLFDMRGRVVGINGRGSFEERGRVNVGLGYAISANQVRRFLPGLHAGGIVHHGTLGATVRQIGARVIFDAIQELSPAERAGIQLGDVLCAVDGRPIRTSNEFSNAIVKLPEDWPVVVEVERDGRRLRCTARLERLALRGNLIYAPDPTDQQRETERIARLAQQRLNPAGVAPVRAWSGTIQDAAAAAPFRLRLTEDGAAEIEAGGRQLTLDAAAQLPPAEAADAPWHEIRAILAPLSQAARLSEVARLRAGDEIDGHVVAVLERRTPDDTRLFWLLDAADGTLRGANRGDASAPRRVTWRLTDEPLAAVPRWRRTWTRTCGERTTIIRFDAAPPTSTQSAGSNP